MAFWDGLLGGGGEEAGGLYDEFLTEKQRAALRSASSPFSADNLARMSVALAKMAEPSLTPKGGGIASALAAMAGATAGGRDEQAQALIKAGLTAEQIRKLRREAKTQEEFMQLAREQHARNQAAAAAARGGVPGLGGAPAGPAGPMVRPGPAVAPPAVVPPRPAAPGAVPPGPQTPSEAATRYPAPDYGPMQQTGLLGGPQMASGPPDELWNEPGLFSALQASYGGGGAPGLPFQAGAGSDAAPTLRLASAAKGGATPDDPRGLVPYIREAAARYGVDPGTATEVARREGLTKFLGDGGKSGGAFQLYTGGGMGNEFQRDTGLDPLDPRNEKATIDYALSKVPQTGWTPFKGAANAGIPPRAGIGGEDVVLPPAPGQPRGVSPDLLDLVSLAHLNYGGTGALGDPNTPGWAAENLTNVTAPGGAKFRVHNQAAPDIQGFLTELEERGYPVNPKTSGGHAHRNIRGGSTLSEHAYGTAIDVNWDKNAYTKNGQLITDLPSDVAQIAAKYNLEWGGNWKSPVDAMHFQWRPPGVGAAGGEDVVLPPAPGQSRGVPASALRQAQYGGGGAPSGAAGPLAAPTRGGGLNDPIPGLGMSPAEIASFDAMAEIAKMGNPFKGYLESYYKTPEYLEQSAGASARGRIAEEEPMQRRMKYLDLMIDMRKNGVIYDPQTGTVSTDPTYDRLMNRREEDKKAIELKYQKELKTFEEAITIEKEKRGVVTAPVLGSDGTMSEETMTSAERDRRLREQSMRPNDFRPGDIVPKPETKPEPGYTLKRGPSGDVTSAPVPGSAAAEKASEAARAKVLADQQLQISRDTVVRSVDRIEQNLNNAILPATGLLGPVVSRFGGTAASNIASDIATLKARSSLDSINALRQQGGTLGQITEGEHKLLADSIASLEQSQTEQQFRENLQIVKQRYIDAVHGPGAYDKHLAIKSPPTTRPGSSITKEAYDKLPSGSPYTAPDGSQRIKP